MSRLAGLLQDLRGYSVRPHRPPGDAVTDFPLTDLMDQDACYAKLVALLHPDGLTCPSCKAADRLRVHRRHRAAVLDYLEEPVEVATVERVDDSEVESDVFDPDRAF